MTGKRQRIHQLAAQIGFDLAGVTSATPAADYTHFREWADRGMAGEMRYLTDRRGEFRADPRNLLASAKSIICVGSLYNSAHPLSIEEHSRDFSWISRYSWGLDYHIVMRNGLRRLVDLLEAEFGPFEHEICVDTAPVLERTYARLAGLGWIGKNTCLIHEGKGSWYFLGEVLTSLEIEPDQPPPDRCGTCTRCIDACPTQALVPGPDGRYLLNSRDCISYLTIELRGPVPEELHAPMGRHVFGCDICQDVCPWNGKAPIDCAPEYMPRNFAPPLEELAALTEEEFRNRFRDTPILRAKYAGFRRNLAIAMHNVTRRPAT